LVVLASVAGVGTEPDGGLSLHLAKQDVERAGFTPVGFALGLRRLRKKGFVSLYDVEDRDGRYEAVRVTDEGWDWIEKNEAKFILRKPEPDPDPDPMF